ncbi:hypothetical protein DSO57_1012326 [Entomophthora muscae]|uniref:Uncharacterized protein n=1 Tax=Entomophthora muscae TaxID=34485 RepID=A0ACC2U4G5_9FUNG|nr:hypothetical protein DSO57_1012326 [Entomophthora muscae]
MDWVRSSLLVIVLLVYSLRKRSLSNSGAIGAIFVGFTTFLNPQLLTTIVLITFFISGSIITKFKAQEKKKLEVDYKEGGQRNIIQVLCNGLTGSVMSLAYQLFISGRTQTSSELCLADGGWTSFFIFGFIGHYACCCADTWASELGILNYDWPYLITTFEQVPPGTNGAISLVGTLASLMGGQVVGLVAALSLRQQHPECGFRLGIMGLGMLTGLVGSMIDSLLGATVQATYYQTSTMKIVPKESRCKNSKQSEKEELPDVKLIAGYDFMDNNMVNLTSSLATSLLAGILGSWLLSNSS